MGTAYRDKEGRAVCVWRNWLAPNEERPGIEFRFAEIDGRVECVSIEIGAPLTEHKEGPRFDVRDEYLVPLAATALRLPFRQLMDEALRTFVRTLEGVPRWTAEARTVEAAERRLPAARAAREQKKVGRPPKYGHEHFEKVARLYNPRAGSPAASRSRSRPRQSGSLELDRWTA
jgi:hypothetical protein